MFTCKKCRVRVRVRLWPFRCICGCRYESPSDPGTCRDIATAHREPYVWPPNGVGTIVKAMLAEIGAMADDRCFCNFVAKQMNDWGPKGCRKHRSLLASLLKASAKKLGVPKLLAKAVVSLKTSWAWQIDLRDPFGSLVDIAIRRSELSTLPTP